MSKIPARVNALIAKAQDTEFEAERDAYLAKAQQLMEDHAITQHQLDMAKPNERVEPIEIYVLIKAKSPGCRAKGSLLIKLAQHNRCQVRTSWYNKQTMERGDWWIIQGMPADAEFVETMWTSLCLQLEQSYHRAIKAGKKPEWTNGRTYRASFYQAFMTRVSNRLEDQAIERDRKNMEESGQRALVLADSLARVTAAFGSARYSSYRASASCAAGKADGHQAGSNARLSGNGEISSRKALVQ